MYWMHRILDWARGLTVYWIRLLLLLLLPLLLWPLLLPPLFFLQSLRVPWAFYPLLLLLLAALLSCALLLPLPPLLTLPPVACVLVMYGCCSKVPVLRKLCLRVSDPRTTAHAFCVSVIRAPPRMHSARHHRA